MDAPRDMLEEALAIIDQTTRRLPERAHLVALHRFSTDLIRLRVHQLLRALDAEHSHTSGDCPTCDWIEAQPEWEERLMERREEAERNARDTY